MNKLQYLTLIEEGHILNALYNAIYEMRSESTMHPMHKKNAIRGMASAFCKVSGITPHSNYKLHNARKLSTFRKG